MTTVLPLLALLLAPAQPPEAIVPLPLDAAREEARAILAGPAPDEARLRSIGVDPFLLADALQAAAPPGDDAPLRRDAALAALAGQRKDPALTALVESWRSWDAERHARERRLRSTLRETAAALRSGRAREALASADEDDRAAGPGSVAAAALLYERARALQTLRRGAETTRALRRAALAARELGWGSMEAYVWDRAAELDAAEGRDDASLEAREEQARVQERTGHLAAAHRVRGRIAWFLYDRNQRDRARAVAEQCLTRAQEDGDEALVAWSRWLLGSILSRLGDLDRAQELLDAALETFRRIGDRREVSLALQALAYQHRARGAYDRAREMAEESLGLREALGDRTHAALMRANLGLILLDQGHLVPAREHFERALRELEGQPAPGAASIRVDLAVTCEKLGDLARAQELAERAFRELPAATAPRADWCLRLGSVFVGLGQLDRGEGLLQQAVELTRKAGDRSRAALARSSLGGARLRRGDFAAALDDLQGGLEELEATGDRIGAAEVRVNLAEALNRVGAHRRALELLERSLPELEALGDRRGAGAARLAQGNSLLLLGEPGQALPRYERALRELEELGDRLGAARALLNIASAHFQLGDLEEAEALSRRALRAREDLGDPHGVALALRRLGRVLARSGRTDEALGAVRRSLEIEEGRHDRNGTASALRLLASVELERGAPGPALDAAERSTDLQLRLGLGLAGEDALGLSEYARAGSDLGLCAIAKLADGAPARDALLGRAFRLVESGRALVLAEDLAHRQALLEATLPEALRRAGAAARARVEAGLRAGDARALDAAYQELETVVARTQREARRAADVVFPQPIEAGALPALLGPDAALVLYQLTSNGPALALVARGSGLELVDLGRSDDLERRVRAWLALLSEPGLDDRDEASALYDALLRPLEGALGGASRLLLAPDGGLSFLPFEALLRVAPERAERAVERWEIARVPSATTLAALTRDAAAAPAGRGVLALGDPVYEAGPPAPAPGAAVARGPAARLRRLPGSGDEARAISELFPESERTLLLRDRASRAEMRRALESSGRRSAVHLACHGFLDAERPRLTGLVLTGGEVLSLDDVYRLRVPADLTVLSGCETGRGRLVRGEGVVGLVGGFFFAGSPRVIVSGWNVEDESARDFMVAFYRRMVKEGLAPGAALRAVQRERLAGGGARAHPHHWAPFALWGLP